MNDNHQQTQNQETYVPKPGEVIKPQRSNQPNVSQAPMQPVLDSNAVASSLTSPTVNVEPMPTVTSSTTPDSLTGQPLFSLEKTDKVDEVIVPAVPAAPKPKFKLPEIPLQVKKIIKTLVVSFVLLIILGGGVAYFLPMFMPKPEEVVPEPIVLPPVVREEPREDKTSLRYLDSKLREIKPSLDELNNDSVFLFEINLNDSDF